MQQVEKKKILMLTDHPFGTSGVGTQSRWLINGLIATGKYSFRVFGGAQKHQNYNETVVNSDFIIKPTDGYGNPQLLRRALAQVKPDVLLLFTDPRFFLWAWEMEEEIHQVCPIAYNHLWDAPPWPEFNRVLYESTDLINCINWPTYEMVSERLPDRTNYIPHAVPKELFKPMQIAEVKRFKRTLLGPNKENDFIVLYVSRNARRKMPSDILVSWKMFLDRLEKEHGHRNATMIMHANPLDPEGANLHHVLDLLKLKENVMFSKEQIEHPDLVTLYNICDTVVNRSCNEGFGLGTLEAMMCGKPIIAIKTGGLTRQVEDHETGEQYGIALEPDVKCLTGNQMVPYIYEDFVSHETLANAFTKMYEMGPEERERIGQRAMAHVHKDYDLNTVVNRWDETLTNLVDKWRASELPCNKRWEHVEL